MNTLSKNTAQLYKNFVLNRSYRTSWLRSFCDKNELKNEEYRDEDEWAYETYVRKVLEFKEDTEFTYKDYIRRPDTEKIKGAKKPFVKNLFKAEFDRDILTYPQVLDSKQLNSLDNNVHLIDEFLTDNIDSASIDKNGKIPDVVMNTIKSLGLFAQKTPTCYHGLNFTATEHARIMEVLSKDISLAMIQYMHENFCIKNLVKYGSDEQKDKYLKKLATGEWLGTYCSGEENNNFENIFNFDTKAMMVDDNWVLNGKKCWVVNGENSDFYLVVARTAAEARLDVRFPLEENQHYFYFNDKKYYTEDIMREQYPYYYSNNVTAFIVEKNFNGITYEPSNAFGLRGANLCNITFKDTIVPNENVLGPMRAGHDIVVQNIANDRYVIGCMAATNMRTMLDELSQYSLNAKWGRKFLRTHGLNQTRIAQLNIKLYAIESMIYLTSGMIDSYDNYDASVESAIVKVFSSEAALECLQMCTQTYGVGSYSKDHPLFRHMQDVTALSLFDVSNDFLRLFIASMGLKYIAEEIQEEIKMTRNPFMFPNHAIKMMWRTRRQSIDALKLHLKLYEFLHPSLKRLSDMLEYCALRFEYCIKMSVCRYGPFVNDKEKALKRIADCAISIYAMTAVLGRASRSYCIGLTNSNEELKVAETFIRDEHRKLKLIFEELIGGDYFTTDNNYELLSEKTITSKGYFCEHPLKDNY